MTPGADTSGMSGFNRVIAPLERPIPCEVLNFLLSQHIEKNVVFLRLQKLRVGSNAYSHSGGTRSAGLATQHDSDEERGPEFQWEAGVTAS